jgi:hypothetical protein
MDFILASGRLERQALGVHAVAARCHGARRGFVLLGLLLERRCVEVDRPWPSATRPPHGEAKRDSRYPFGRSGEVREKPAR